ncbi:MAG TPA: VOC family protein [Steroidobacteraceae bacterium]|nr:VOC family protein [Steroidobacteraceae bacterium]
MAQHLRISRPCTDILKTTDMYCRGLGLTIVGSFENHDGFDGVMLGRAGLGYHFEFTHCRSHPVAPTPTKEDLFVFYIAALNEWRDACTRMIGAGFKEVDSFNPYWDINGRTFEDLDGYRVVLQNAEWNHG